MSHSAIERNADQCDVGVRRVIGDGCAEEARDAGVSGLGLGIDKIMIPGRTFCHALSLWRISYLGWWNATDRACDEAS
jgi:hypothetical protein